MELFEQKHRTVAHNGVFFRCRNERGHFMPDKNIENNEEEIPIPLPIRKLHFSIMLSRISPWVTMMNHTKKCRDFEKNEFHLET